MVSLYDHVHVVGGELSTVKLAGLASTVCVKTRLETDLDVNELTSNRIY
jgi:hypothetical protein